MNSILAGLKIFSTSFDDDEITFTKEDGTNIIFQAYGDCCSQSFIESIDDHHVLQDCTILSVEEVEGESASNENDYTQECQKWTFYKFKTDKGYATLSFRNDSNGYYDGSLELKGRRY